MADLLLGRLVELVVREPGTGLRTHAPRGLWLAWDSRTGRLWAVQRGRRLGRAADADRARVAGFHWEDVDADVFETFRPRERGAARIGELAAVVYEATKGRELADWEHWFREAPVACRTARGEWVFRGRVAVSDRGITS